MCGALRASDAGKKAVLMGWVNRRRDLGNLLFVDVRDRSGLTRYTQIDFTHSNNLVVVAGALHRYFENIF